MHFKGIRHKFNFRTLCYKLILPSLVLKFCFCFQVLDKYKWEDLEDCKEEETCPYLDSVTFMLLQSIVQAVQGI